MESTETKFLKQSSVDLVFNCVLVYAWKKARKALNFMYFNLCVIILKFFLALFYEMLRNLRKFTFLYRFDFDSIEICIDKIFIFNKDRI